MDFRYRTWVMVLEFDIKIMEEVGRNRSRPSISIGDFILCTPVLRSPQYWYRSRFVFDSVSRLGIGTGFGCLYLTGYRVWVSAVRKNLTDVLT
ncbi:hypothetical protein IFM89_032807 [Coptis chinensis]|uniref:Uncharacterized protein n=1 Tax=Coptis chinensis TaxID=261450 RepID=A0A835HNT3_9MAGN|nr:hypothetical protein IFM89_032807 [Coptis chinensis]